MQLRIMYLSPVADTLGGVSPFVEAARDYVLPGTEVHLAALPDSVGRFSHVEYRAYEAMVTAGIIRATIAAAEEGFDALVIGCFYDTALLDAREISRDMAVVGPCSASCEIAAGLANRYGIIVGRRKWVHQMEATVREYGHAHRVSGFYHVELGVDDFQKDRRETRRRLVETGRLAVEQDFAEAIILGCTMEVGFFRDLASELGVPVIDPAVAALKRAEYAAMLKRQCGWSPSRRWSCEAPPETEMTRLGAFYTGDPFGTRIIINLSRGSH